MKLYPSVVGTLSVAGGFASARARIAGTLQDPSATRLNDTIVTAEDGLRRYRLPSPSTPEEPTS